MATTRARDNATDQRLAAHAATPFEKCGPSLPRRFHAEVRSHDYRHIRYTELTTSLRFKLVDAPMDTRRLEPSLRKFQKELSAGTVSLVLLAVLAARRSRCTATRSPSSSNSRRGRAQRQAERAVPGAAQSGGAGLLRSEVEPSVAGPPRRYYRITDAGRACCDEWAATWRATRDSVDSVLEGLMP